jgi:hypothetical protein
MVVRRILTIASVVLALAVVYWLRMVYDEGHQWKLAITADGRGYYGYLPAILIHHDLQWRWLTSEELKIVSAEESGNFVVPSANGGTVNKCFAGVACAMLPFFLAAHGAALVFGLDAGGYSPIYAASVDVAALSWCFIGLLLFYRWLRRRIGNTSVAFTVTLLLFWATNLSFYTIVQPSMGHVYGFAVIAALLWLSDRWTEKRRWLWAMCLLGGLLPLIRPTDALLVLALPFIAGSKERLKAWGSHLRSSSAMTLIVAVFLLALPLLVQMALWHAQTGLWLVYSYGKERFYWTDPHAWEVLIGFRKGWLIYTPLMLLIVPGWIVLFGQNRFQAVSYATFITVVIYVTSCWWYWAYGDSFGQRALVDFYPVLAVPIAHLFMRTRSVIARTAVASVCAFFLLLNNVQGFQLLRYILLWERMDFASYKAVFLKTGEEYVGFLGSLRKPFMEYTVITPDTVRTIDFEEGAPALPAHALKARTGIGAGRISAERIYQDLLRLPRDNEARAHELLVTLHGFARRDVEDFNGHIVISAESDGQSYSYTAVNLLPYLEDADAWEELRFERRLPPAKGAHDELKVYGMNDKGVLWLDDWRVEVFSLQDDTAALAALNRAREAGASPTLDK